MLTSLLQPPGLVQIGLVLFAVLISVISISKVPHHGSSAPAARALVWMMVLATILPVTLDRLVGGGGAGPGDGSTDQQLGVMGQAASRGTQIALVVVAVVAMLEATRRGVRGTTGLFWAFVLSWFATVLSAINSDWSPKLLGWLLPLVVLALFAAARAGAPLIQELRRVMMSIIVVSLALYFYNPALATLSATRAGSGSARLAGVFSHPNGMGAAAAVALILMLTTSSGFPRVVGVLVSGFALELSDSRTALVAVAVSVPLILAAPTSTASSHQVRRLAVLLGSLAGGFLLVQGLLTNSTDVASVNGRTLVWDYVLQEWHTQPLLGAGPDGWNSARLLAQVPAYAGQAHNQFFESLYLFGLAGVFGLFLLVGIAMVKAGRHWRAGFPMAAALLVCLLVTGFSESPLKFDISGLTAEGAIGLVALAMVQVRLPRRDENREAPSVLAVDDWTIDLAHSGHG